MYIYLDLVEDFNCEMCGTCCRRDWLITLDESSYHRNLQLFESTDRAAEFAAAFVPIAEQKAFGECLYCQTASRSLLVFDCRQ